MKNRERNFEGISPESVNSLKEKINNLKTTLEKNTIFGYTKELIKKELEKLEEEYKYSKDSIQHSKLYALISVNDLMEKFKPTGEIEKTKINFERINNKIEVFENSYKEKGYYGIGTLSIPSKEDKITLKYCIDVFF